MIYHLNIIIKTSHVSKSHGSRSLHLGYIHNTSISKFSYYILSIKVSTWYLLQIKSKIIPNSVIMLPNLNSMDGLRGSWLAACSQCSVKDAWCGEPSSVGLANWDLVRLCNDRFVMAGYGSAPWHLSSGRLLVERGLQRLLHQETCKIENNPEVAEQ